MSSNPRDWTILLVEDQLPNLELVQMILESRQVKVHTARNGQEGLTVLETLTPTAVLLDLSMPVMDGWTMMAHMQQDQRLRTIPVIALTAYGLENDVKRVLETGFASIIVKPFSPNKVITEIANCLTNSTVNS